MIPAEEMFQNIAEFLRASVVRVATTKDIEDSYKSAESQGEQTITRALGQDIPEPSQKILKESGDPNFIILEHPDWMRTSAWQDKILGAITYDPLRYYGTYISEGLAEYISHDLQEGSVTDFVLNRDFRHPLTSIGQFLVSGSRLGNRVASAFLDGTLIRYKRIRQLDEYWAKLRDDPKVKRAIEGSGSIWSTQPAYLVVGIMICEDVEIIPNAELAQESKAQGKIPVGEILLPSGGVNLPRMYSKLGAASSSHTATLFQAKSGESKIFAVELKKVTTRVLHRKLLSSKGERPLNLVNFGLTSMNSDEDNDEKASGDPDLILAELDAETVRDMIGER